MGGVMILHCCTVNIQNFRCDKHGMHIYKQERSRFSNVTGALSLNKRGLKFGDNLNMLKHPEHHNTTDTDTLDRLDTIP